MSISNKDKISIARAIAIISASFSVIICVMLIANYLQFKSIDPLESEAFNTLVERLHDNPQDEVLKEDIRALDLLIRKAYFTSQWQIRTGAYLLLLGVIISILAIRFQNTLKSKLDELESIEKDPFLDKQLAQKWVIYVGSGLVVLALLSGFLSYNSLDTYVPELIVKTEVPVQKEQTETVVKEIVQPEQVAVFPKKEKEEQAPVQIAEEISAEIAQSATKSEKKITPEKQTPAVKKPVTTASTKTVSQEELNKNFPFFRGPHMNGIAHQTNIPENWDGASGENILWKVKPPKNGFNSPILWGDKLFISGADDKARQVYCYHKDTGELLWQANADNISGSPSTMPKTTADTGLAASTMATNGNAVFAIFGSGDLIALDLNGKRLWAKNLGVPDNHYGHSSSLIIYKDKLIVQYDTNKGGKVIAFESSSGEKVWETIRSGVRISWATPVITNSANRDELILNAEPLVVAYNPNTGAKLWELDCMMGEVGPSIGYADGIAYAANEYATLAAIDTKTGEIIWEGNEYLPEVSSPLAADGLLIIATSYGLIVCYDAKDGTKYWEQEYADGIYSSPILVDGKVYMIDMSGKMHIFKLAKEFESIAEPELGEKAACTPAFANGRIYIKGFDHLYCIGK